MKTYTAEELKEILDKHKKWFTNEPDGQRANLEGAYLKGANLYGAYLNSANLKGANLYGAYLNSANLEGAYLEGANLEGANLFGAYLYGANLYGANLYGAYLYGAYLNSANLEGAYLEGANLKGANLYGVKNPPQYLIDYFKKDLLYVLLHSPRTDIEILREKVIAGEIQGTQYSGDCACLIGTLYKADGSQNENEFVKSHIPFYECGLHNPSEQLFYQIRKGDTPETNQFAKIAIEVIDMVLGETNVKGTTKKEKGG
jgi:uncharacterized protein YjbI with pentapeptide repeats